MLDQKIKTFLSVVENRSFTAAAQELCLTQPAVSQQINGLEKELGCTLFQRKGKIITLTAEGAMVFKAARSMRNDEMRLTEHLHQAAQAFPIHFGATLTIAEYMMLDEICHFIQAHSDTNVEMLVTNTGQLLSLLDSGDLDFALVEGEFSPVSYGSEPLGLKEYLCVAAPSPAIPAQPIHLGDLLGHTLITREKGSGTRAILDGSLQVEGLSTDQFASVIQLGNIAAIKAAVKSGAGITFLYRDAVTAELEEGSLQALPIIGFPLSHEISFIYRKGSLFESEYKGFYQELKG